MPSSPRLVSSRLGFFLSFGVVACAAGCNAPVDEGPLECDPLCAPGYACSDEGICIVDPLFDAGVVVVDMARPVGPCDPACTPAAPLCTDKGQCVVCIADKDCPAGTLCKDV